MAEERIILKKFAGAYQVMKGPVDKESHSVQTFSRIIDNHQALYIQRVDSILMNNEQENRPELFGIMDIGKDSSDRLYQLALSDAKRLSQYTELPFVDLTDRAKESVLTKA